MKILGVDEAGRGPVIGPLVIGAVLINEQKQEQLKNIGVKDSKLLSISKREELFKRIIEIADDYAIIEIDEKEVDRAVFSKTYNLNFLEADNYIATIKQLKPDRAILDCPSSNAQAFKEYVISKVGQMDLIIEHKADLNYIEVGAASILAKVTRDRKIEQIKKKIGIDFGSGYPSDPKTQKFLKNHYSKFNFIRKSWSSYQKLVQNENQTKLGSF